MYDVPSKAQHNNTTNDVTRGARQAPKQNATQHNTIHGHTTPRNANTTTYHNRTPNTTTYHDHGKTRHDTTRHNTPHNITTTQHATRRHKTTRSDARQRHKTRNTTTQRTTIQRHTIKRNTTPHNEPPRDNTQRDMTRRHPAQHATTQRQTAKHKTRHPGMTTPRSFGMTSAAAAPKRCIGSAAPGSPGCMPAHFADGRTPSAQPRRRAKPNPTTSRSTRCAG